MITGFRGGSLILRALFYEYEDGPLYDPVSDGIHPTLRIYHNNNLILGPLTYSNGTGEIIRQSKGNYYYTFSVLKDYEPGLWVAQWFIDDIFEGEETFEIIDQILEPNLAENLLRKPTLSASMGESPLYQILGTGITDTVFLIGHADGLELNDPYRVGSMQEAISALLADSSSPLLKALLEVYYAGCRDVYLVASAPMDEYIDNLDDRLQPNSDWDSKTFYEVYKDRLDITYELLKEWDTADIVVPLEAPFYDAGGVDFLEQLTSYCQDFFDISGKAVMGLMGTRGAVTDQMVEDLIVDARPKLIGAGGKFVSIIAGDGIINNRELPVTYSGSVVPSVAGMLSQLPLNRGIPYLPLSNVITTVGKDLTESQVQSLATAKINTIIRTNIGKRGGSFNSVIATDNTLASNGSDYWSMLQMRLITKIIEKMRTLGRAYIGTVGFADFKNAAEQHMLNLVRADWIRDFTLRIDKDPLNPNRATVDISVRPYFGIREIFASIEVGPAISLGAVR